MKTLCACAFPVLQLYVVWKCDCNIVLDTLRTFCWYFDPYVYAYTSGITTIFIFPVYFDAIIEFPLFLLSVVNLIQRNDAHHQRPVFSIHRMDIHISSTLSIYLSYNAYVDRRLLCMFLIVLLSSKNKRNRLIFKF